MYLRTVKASGAKGVQHEYLRLVESYREDGKNKQRVVAHLGRKDVLAPHVDALVRILTGKKTSEQAEAVKAWDWGPVLILRKLWQQMGLERILDRLDSGGDARHLPLADRSFVLVANRLLHPGSEHALAAWLETDYVCDRRGRVWKPQWRDDEERLKSTTPRVRVEAQQLQRWYRTLDHLYEHKSQIEVELYRHLRDLFSLEIDLAFYDLTSTYFEGQGPFGLATHGHSRDGKPRNRQVLVGVVMVQGWPLAHHVFRGNLRDSTTLKPVLEDLQRRFAIRRVILVGDRGMVTSENLERLRREGHGYVVGLNRRRNAQITAYLEQAQGPWQECPVGITASEKSDPPITRVQEVRSSEPGVRVFVVQSEERKLYERAERRKAMRRTRQRLEKLRVRVERGRLKAPEKIGAAAARILQKNHGSRYYDWECSDGQFRYFEHPVNLPRERALEGKYLIQTEEPHLGPVEAVQIYKSLSEVERAFRNLKDVLEMRPIFHQTAPRVEAHLFVAHLAFLLQRALERQLKEAGLDLSPPQALHALRTIRVVDIDLGDGKTKRSVTRGSARCGPILKALDIHELEPPAPPKDEPELM